MMRDSEMLKIINNRGEAYVLHPNYHEFAVLEVKGLEQPDVTVNISESGTMDGGRHNSSHIGVRDIVINMVSFGWTEAERKKMYRIFPPKSAVDLFYRNSQYNVRTVAHVKHIDPVSYFDKTKVRIELVCPDPFLHDVDGITAETSGTTPTVTIKNVADTDIGFTAEITISTEDEPFLNYTTTQSETAEYLGSHAFCVLPGGYYYDNVDLANETFNIYVNGNLKTASDGVTRDLLTNSDGHNYLYVHSENGGLANSNIGVEHIVDETQNVTDMRYFESSTINGTTYEGNYSKDITVPSWYDFSKNKITFDQTNYPITVTEIRKIQNEDGTYNVTFNFFNADYPTSHRNIEIIGKLHLFGSVSGVDVHADTIVRSDPGGGFATGTYTKYILSPTLPTYDPSKDILRVYKGDTLLQSDGYEFQTVTKSDGTTETLFSVSSGTIDRQITFEAISSQGSTDIRDYTQEQIDTAMCLVDGLTITNMVSGEYMAFPNYQFKNGDVLSVSTVAGNIDAKVSNSDTEKSLIAEVINNGSFFKLKPGTNVIQITADTNNDYVSGVFGAEMLYGGV